jgi:hypothetical protein
VKNTWVGGGGGGERGVLRKEEVRFPYQERELPLLQLPTSLRYHPPSVLSQKAYQYAYKGIVNRHLNLKRLFGPSQIFQLQEIFQGFVNCP